MRAQTTTATAVLLLAVLVAGCSGGDDKPAGEPAAGKKKRSVAAPKPSPSGPLALGQKWEWETEDGDFAAQGNTTVLSYQQRVALDGPQPEEAFGAGSKGYVWVAAELKVCNAKGDSISVSSMPWALAYKDGARIEASDTTYGHFPKPEYPHVDALVAAGRCLRGNLVFSVPSSGRPEAVVYAPQDFERPIEWAVPRG